MAGSMIAGTHWNESEFQGGLTALCGPNALAMAESALTQHYTNTLTVFQKMHAVNRCAANGASTMANLQLQARADGFTHTVMLGWNGNGYPQSTWQSFLTTHLHAGAVVLLETNNGQALKDYVSGQGEDATNLQYHFILLLGYNAGGYSPTLARSVPFGFIATDGANNAMNPIVGGKRTRVLASTSVLQYYPTTVLAATRPGALLAIYPKPVPAPTPPPAPAPAPQPAPPVPTPTPAPTTFSLSLSADEVHMLESVLARLPK